jgi:site-specific recombinase XerC
MDDALRLRQLDPFIGSLELRQVHMGNLRAFIARRRQDGVKTKTLNMALAVVRRVLNLASSEWMDRAGWRSPSSTISAVCILSMYSCAQIKKTQSPNP